MTEQEILPCPNPECRCRCQVVDDEMLSPLFAVYCAGCEYSGPVGDSPDIAARLHNAIPREEPWIEVAKAGLPEPSEQLYDVAGEHDGKPFLTEMVTRADVSWELGNATVRVHSDKYGGVSHYRIHRAPKGPR